MSRSVPQTKIFLYLVLVLIASSGEAWFTQGHRIVAEAAVDLLPEDVPEFFRNGARAVGQGAIDPDVMKLYTFRELSARENPEHYLDVELLGGRQLPPTRYEYIRMVTFLGAKRRGRTRQFGPADAGFLPYAIVEGAQQLTVAFAEFRRWPDDPDIQAKTLLWAGWLAHYASDLCQPLHTTIHHDGRAKPDTSSPHTGFHQQVDVLFEKNVFDPNKALKGIKIRTVDDFMRSVKKEFEKSHALVDELYRLESILPPANEPFDGPAPTKVREFSADRFRESVRFTASLFVTAWEKSASVELQSWLTR